MKIHQTEFDFSAPSANPAFSAGSERAVFAEAVFTKRLPRTRRIARHAVRQPNRLAISPEAFEAEPPTRPGDSGRREGTFEAIATLLATVVFGLGWAAMEFEQVDFPGSRYDAVGPASIDFWEATAAGPGFAAIAQSRGGRDILESTDQAYESNKPWTRMKPDEQGQPTPSAPSNAFPSSRAAMPRPQLMSPGPYSNPNARGFEQ